MIKWVIGREILGSETQTGEMEKKAYNLVCMLYYDMPLIVPMLLWSAVF